MVVSKLNYEEEWEELHLPKLSKPLTFRNPRRRRKFSYTRKDLANCIYASSEAREYDINKADELEARLEGGHPLFVKPMLQSHVSGGFWLGSLRFCHNHLAEARKGELKWGGSTDRIAYPQMLKFMQK